MLTKQLLFSLVFGQLALGFQLRPDQQMFSLEEQMLASASKKYEDTKIKFLEDYYKVDQENNALMFAADIQLPDDLAQIASQDITYKDPDDTSDLYPGKTDRYNGITQAGWLSFGHLPMEMHCFDGNMLDELEFDIAVIGAPFDTGISYKPGARFGPDSIRQGTRRFSGGFSPYRKGFSVWNNWAKIVDCGNVPMTPLDNRIALDQLYRSERVLLNHTTTKENPGKHPRFVALGGDHTITYSGIRAAYEKYGKVSVLHFDSHLDTVNPYHMNPNVTEYAALNHGTYLNWAHKKGWTNTNNIHAGLRGWYEDIGDPERDYTESGFSKIMARDIDSIGIHGIIHKIKKTLGDSPVYISFDIDVLDPASAPSTGAIEPGGWTSRELLQIIDGLAGITVVGADVTEVSPWGDSTNEITSIIAGEVTRSILALMVIKPVE
ncbi:hypothetical protein OGAPHI_001364 [Ogataea philodendri]|uniref:Agmatinase n=1 Tax=Ogataea philodendri TaxID=1378263 RepID=A0A9P8T7J2_9ASCO|nr:uncharacterized protein OGAPHI_001364 [Ogataea philodendri]KAH3669243.1 hypothetical protein OGAPHI_001364 [Ogataea philodendri]